MDILSLLQIIHFGICFILIVTVLLQFGRGAEAGVFSSSSSSSQGIFSSSTKGNFLTKLTTFCAVTFMLTSISLGVLTARKAHESVLDGKIDAVNVRLNNDAPVPNPAQDPAASTTTPAAPTKKP